MNKEITEAINDFFNATKKLKELGITRSTQYVGNIAEFICSEIYDITLSNSQREQGLDGIDKNYRKVEIKYHNAPVGTNLILDKYIEIQNFQDLIVILGIDSSLRPKGLPEGSYPVYRINDYSYKKYGNLAKTNLKEIGIDKLLDQNFEVITSF